MQSSVNGVARVNSYALVAYIPEPLGSFLDQVRRALVPSCALQAHVSILPPRPLTAPPELALEQIQDWAENTPPFLIEATEIEIFPVTNVIYIAVGRGSTDLYRMHDELNSSNFRFAENFEYHPHITLAQELTVADVEAVSERARQIWAGYDKPRTFFVDRVAFVQNTVLNKWVDIAECRLGAAILSR